MKDKNEDTQNAWLEDDLGYDIFPKAAVEGIGNYILEIPPGVSVEISKINKDIPEKPNLKHLAAQWEWSTWDKGSSYTSYTIIQDALPEGTQGEECPECGGGGMIAKLYPQGHTEVSCEECCGLGWLETTEQLDSKVKCECGADSIKSSGHSDWCPAAGITVYKRNDECLS